LKLAEQRCQLDKSDLRKKIAQSQEGRREDADQFNKRIDKITADLARSNRLIHESESALNAANTTTESLREEINRLKVELGKAQAEMNNPTGDAEEDPNTIPSAAGPAAANARVPTESIVGDAPDGAGGGIADLGGAPGPEEPDPAVGVVIPFLPWRYLHKGRKEWWSQRSKGQKCMFLDFCH
jgi:hypothetical protein